MTAINDGCRADKRKARQASTYFVAPDGFGHPQVWLENGDWPVEVVGIDGWRVQCDHPELWATIVAAVEGGAR